MRFQRKRFYKQPLVPGDAKERITNKMTKIRLFIAGILVFCVTSLGLGTAPTLAKVNQKDLECLAKNVYHEARGESVSGQYAVAAVTVNRVRDSRFPLGLCNVVYQSGQFSWVRELKSHLPKDREAYQRAKYIAATYLSGAVKDPTNGALWYHTYHVKPKWRHYVSRTTQIGSHIFYS